MIVPRTLLALMATVLLSAPVAAGAQSDAEAEREEVRERTAEVAAELDVLEASNAEIEDALDAIEAQVSAQRAALAEAEQATAEAEAAVRRAEIDLGAARHDVRVLEAAIRDMAIASYMHPPTADLVRSLEARSFSDALLQRAYLDARAERDVDLLALLEEAEAIAVRRAADLDAAAEQAARAVEDAMSALARLESELADQARFASRVRDRIDASLAEAAVLAEMDAELAAQIQAEQAALIARIPPPTEVVQVEPPRPTPAVAAPEPSTTTTTTAPRSASTVPPATTVPPAPPPPPNGGSTPTLRTVQGITVHADIASDVDALLTAARADGVSLSGWGYRSSDRQIELRMQNCGPTQYDVWYKPPSLCTPPTAIPGRSLHEQGRAIDFTHDGRTITSRSTVAFRWLADHAAVYGLYNLPSEPWHWSTNGG